MSLVLAQNISESITQIIFWCLVLLGLLVVLCLGVWYYRRRWLGSLESPAIAWTLEDLRKLRDEGTLTEEEFQNMRLVVIGALSGDKLTSESASARAGTGQSNAPASDFDLKK